MRRLLLGFVCAAHALLPAAAAAAGAVGWNTLFHNHETLRFAPREARHALAHAFLQEGSDAVHRGDSLLVRNRDYGIDPARGMLFLLAPAESLLVLDVSYAYLPAPARQRFRAVDIVPRAEALATPGTPSAGTTPAAATPGAPARGDLTLPPTLRLSGSKTIGVSLGRNRDATIDQSLRVEAAGDLGEGLRVNAVLADDNLPVLPEGNTEELGDLSKVFIEVQGPVVGGVLGDYTLERPGDLTAVRRDLRGGELRLHFGNETLALGAGLARGEFATATFRGTEGKQGPYELLSVRRLEFSTLVPGSERVYVDGALQRRGENQDYVIDYDRGEVRFTSHRRMTADTEIGVDFQVANQRYRRETKSARVEGGAAAWRWRGFALDDGDVRNKPVGGAYGPEEIAALTAAGDGGAIAAGIRVVGAGHGSYRRDGIDSTIVRFDPVTGDLEVDFYEAGPSRGAYDDSLDALSGRRIFRFVGAAHGDFAIGRRLTPAGRQRLVTGDIETAPWKGAHLRAEASLSDFDANQFSSRDDDDNRGEALEISGDSGARSLGRAGSVALAAHWAERSARFRSPDRGRPAFYYKDWNAESDSLRDTERITETTLHWAAAANRLRIDANAGRLDRRADLRTDRLQLDLGLGHAERSAEFRWQGLDTARPGLGADAGRTRGLRQAAGRFGLGPVVPELHVERDEFVRADADSFARSSYRYLDTRLRIALRETHRTTAAVEFGRRDTDARRPGTERAAGLGEWAEARRNDTWGLEMLARPSLGFGAELGVSRRTNEPRGGDASAATRSDLARAVLSWNPRHTAVRTEWRYEIGEEAVRTLQQVLVLAPDGHGDYDAEGHAVGKDQGLFDKVFRFSGDPENVGSVEATWRLELGGFTTLSSAAPDSSPGWFRRNVSLLQTLGVKEQSRSDHRRDLYLLVPSAYQTGATVFGSFNARQEWSFLSGASRDALKLRLEAEKELDGRFTGAGVRTRQSSGTLRWDRTGVQRWSVGAESGLGSRARRGALDGVVPGRSSSGSHDVRFGALAGRIGYRLSASERLQFDVEWTAQHDAISTTRQQLVTWTPSATIAPLRNLRLFASLAATHVVEHKPPDVLPPFFFDAPGTKTSGSLSGSYRLGQNLNLNLSYSGVRNTDGRSTWDVKAETRAIF